VKELIVLLECVRQTARDCHYRAAGPCFYGQHLLADVISEPIGGFIDRINEVCFLGSEKPAPTSKEINGDLIGILPATITNSVDRAIYHIESLCSDADKRAIPLMQGELNLLGEISEHLMKCKGLLWRQGLEEGDVDE